jgi:hypothetical protein
MYIHVNALRWDEPVLGMGPECKGATASGDFYPTSHRSNENVPYCSQFVLQRNNYLDTKMSKKLVESVPMKFFFRVLDFVMS